MNVWTRSLLPLAGALAVASGCATTRQREASNNPAARQVTASQQRSEQALESAQKAQRHASDEQRKAAQAQRDVQDAQRRLAEAQKRAEAQTAKAEQAQQQANQATRQATQEASQAQQQAARQLANQEQIVSRGEQVVSGQVASASPTQLTVQPQNGQPTTFAITPDTRVLIDGRRASASEIVQGGEARVAYDVTGRSPTALSVHVMTGNVPAPGSASAPASSQAPAAPAPQGTAPAAPSDSGSR